MQIRNLVDCCEGCTRLLQQLQQSLQRARGTRQCPRLVCGVNQESSCCSSPLRLRQRCRSTLAPCIMIFSLPRALAFMEFRLFLASSDFCSMYASANATDLLRPHLFFRRGATAATGVVLTCFDNWYRLASTTPHLPAVTPQENTQHFRRSKLWHASARPLLACMRREALLGCRCCSSLLLQC